MRWERKKREERKDSKDGASLPSSGREFQRLGALPHNFGPDSPVGITYKTVHRKSIRALAEMGAGESVQTQTLVKVELCLVFQ